mgnify:CR=1 FL=1
MPRYIVTLTDVEVQELKTMVQKGGKGYRIKHAQILLKLDQKPENKAWTYDRIKDAYGASRSTIAGIAKRFVMEGMEAALGRKPAPQSDRRCGSPDMHHSLFKTAGRCLTLDYAGNRG